MTRTRIHYPRPLLTLSMMAVASGFFASQLRASIAYGSINNFDCVNDTGSECHGFEIEIEDCHSTDITHTYNYNHYGTPKITQDDSIAGHPKCIIRWESKKNADGSWASYTAIPSGPIAATNGHQFTNPNVNFGGEHFGVGYRVAVGTVRYQWLVDDGRGKLVHGGAVQVSTPSFNYLPPAANQPARVQAVIEPPELPELPVMEFGPAVWVKEIRTKSHNNRKVELRDLVSDDPDDEDEINWKNGEPDEVEVEWQLLQKELTKPDGGNNGRLEAEPEDLDDGDEVVTRRYEFYEYIGPLDEENGEAKAEKVGPDDVHGVGIKEINGVEMDLSTVAIVGDYKGAQMSAVDAEGHLDLIDHLSEGQINQPYAGRRLVVEGPLPFTAEIAGDLPAGMNFDTFTGVLAGTPAESGHFALTATASDGVNPPVTRNYQLVIAAVGELPPPMITLDTLVDPPASGTATGDGLFEPGSEVTLSATPVPGYRFVNWTEQGQVLSSNSTHTVQIGQVNRSFIANFVVSDVPSPMTLSPSSTPGVAFSLRWSLVPDGWILEESPDMTPGSWRPSVRNDNPHDGLHEIEIADPAESQRFFRLKKP
ncbi:MAG: InlB B-repeat-containing protein [Luteolibacter sp.]